MFRTHPEPLAFEALREGLVVRLRVIGEVDLATVPLLEARLAELDAEGSEAAVIDLAGVAFIDSSGVRTLWAWREEARARGVDARLVPPSGPARRVLEITGLIDEEPA